MQKCVDRYLTFPDDVDRELTVVDIGSADMNGSYRSLFPDRTVNYIGVDLESAPGVDLIAEDPYTLPIPDASADVVLSGQTLEHSEYFWLAFLEMIRLLKPEGLLFLIVPSSGPIHRYPVDCYRFYPDALTALAKYADCHLVDSWLDDRGPWNDLVGVFSKTRRERRAEPLAPPQFPEPLLAQTPSLDPDEESTSGVDHYLEVLDEIHELLAPGLYFEIGTRQGASLTLARSEALAVEPWPAIREPLADDITLFRRTSDWFFELDAETALSRRPDLVFIDGMHLIEFALRDFMNVELYSSPTTVVVADDIFPCHAAQAARKRRTRVWTGDVWKLKQCLERYRPDLLLLPIDARPTGLMIILGLDATNRVLREHYNPLIRELVEMQGEPPTEILSRQGAAHGLSGPVRDVLVTLRDSREQHIDVSFVQQLIEPLRQAGESL